MEDDDQHGCLVYGTMGFVLRVSQIYGVGSLRFESVPDGWRIHVSRAANVYCKILIVLTSITSVLGTAWDFTFDTASFHSKNHADSIMTVLSVTVIMSSLLTEAGIGMNRITHILSCLNQIQKIDSELAQYGPRKSFEMLQYVLAVWSLLGGHIIVITDFAILLYEILLRHGDYTKESLYAAYYVGLLMMKVLMLQIFTINMTVLTSFNQVNDCLDQLLRQLQTENVLNESPKSAPITLRRLGLLFCSLRDVVQDLDECHGILMVPLISSFVVHLVVTPYNCISRIFGNKADFYKAISQSWWFFYHLIDMAILVEPCHQSHNQVNRMKPLISQLVRTTPPTQHELLSELNVFYKLLTVKDVVFTPMTMFTLNRSLVATIIGSVTTYLVVVVQL